MKTKVNVKYQIKTKKCTYRKASKKNSRSNCFFFRGYTETIKSGDGEEGEEGEEEEGLLPTDSPSGLGMQQQQDDDLIEQQEIDEIIQVQY